MSNFGINTQAFVYRVDKGSSEVITMSQDKEQILKPCCDRAATAAPVEPPWTVCSECSERIGWDPQEIIEESSGRITKEKTHPRYL